MSNISDGLSGPGPVVLYHVSRLTNRQSIELLGLEPRIQEHVYIERQPAVFLLEFFEQANDYGFWTALHFREAVDIWAVEIDHVHDLSPDTHQEMAGDFNSWRYLKTIPGTKLKIIKSIKAPMSPTEAPVMANKKASRVSSLQQQ